MTTSAAGGPDVVTMGRISVDLYPEQIGVPIAEVRSFAKSVGGSATNVAVAAARLGRRSAVITKVGDDPFGAYLRAALPERFGVDARWVGVDPTLRTPLAFCEVFPPDHFPLLFYREPKAPDMNLSLADLDLGAIAAAPLLWTTGTGLSDEPSREATLAALAARPREAVTVHDLDHRPMFWRSEADAGELARAALRHANVAVGNQDEVAVAVGTRDPLAASAALLELGVRLAVVKQGHRGVLARSADELVEVPPVPVEVVNGLGAGDAFGGSLCHGLLAGWDLERTLRYGNAAGAIVVSRLLCSDAMPTLDEIETLLADGRVPADEGPEGSGEPPGGAPAERVHRA
jgi:5-dehydro-2-deoxygluconokinase